MARGDHIRVSRGFYWHHGIDCGDGTVIHYTGTPTDIQNAAVKQEPISSFAKVSQIEVVTYTVAFDVATTLERARSRLGEKSYHLAFNNCEHFASWCRVGEHRSRQVDFVSKSSFTGRVAVGVGQTWHDPDADGAGEKWRDNRWCWRWPMRKWPMSTL